MNKYYKQIAASKIRVDLVGRRFGRLTVIEMLYENGEHTKVRCRCDCGNEIVRVATYLTSGDTTSCGCYRSERTVESNTKDLAGITLSNGIQFISRAYQKEQGCWMWNCRCHCGNMFVALPAKVQSGHTSSCGCNRRSAKEQLVSHVLSELEIEFDREHRFDGCKDIRELPFDFYLPSENTVIEYNGAQHYFPNDFFGGEQAFIKRQEHDKIKRRFCRKNNIRMIELPYTLSDEEIKEQLQTLFIRRDCNG